MRRVILCLLATALLPVGCASTTNETPPPSQTSMPDARDLSEHPLDVLAMPQP
jgi:hypothetical protein